MLDGEHFAGETFDGLELTGERLDEKDFDNCTFTSCDFTEAPLHRCRFNGCAFRSSELSLIQLGRSSFRDVRLVDCRMMGVDWTQAETSLGLSIAFERCVLDSSSFMEVPLEALQMLECRAKDVNFIGADLTGAEFRGTNLMGSRFTHANLTDADLSNAIDVMLDPTATTLLRTKLSLEDSVRVLAGMGIVVAGFGGEEDG